MNYVKASTVEEAVSLLQRAGSDGLLLAGGTDIMPAMNRVPPARGTTVIYLGGLEELKGIRETGGALQIGALTTDAQLAADPLVRTWAGALAQAAAASAGPQVRNRATIGGNIGTASPSGDLITALLALGATVQVTGQDGISERKLEDVVVGVKRTDLAGQIILSVRIPRAPARTASAFEKMGKRKAMTISCASAACSVTLNPAMDAIEDARIAIGAAAPTAVRAEAAENALRGAPLDEAVIREKTELCRKAINPITDQRATKWYRMEIVPVLTARTLWKAIQALKEEEAAK